MRSIILPILVIAALGATSCRYVGFNLEKYEQAVKSGFPLLPQAKQMEKLFGEGDHFISVSHRADGIETWNTEVWFAGRYDLTMQSQVKVNGDFSKVVSVSSPAFHLAEVTWANSGGACRYGDVYRFGEADWEKVVKAKGDFSVIGLHLTLDSPVPNFDNYVQGLRRTILTVRPDDR